MPAFKLTPENKRKTLSSQVDEIQCPRCVTSIKSKEEETLYRNNAQTRVVRNKFGCSCGYEVTIIERFPAINRASQ